MAAARAVVSGDTHAIEILGGQVIARAGGSVRGRNRRRSTAVHSVKHWRAAALIRAAA